jgi:hypothetical protein
MSEETENLIFILSGFAVFVIGFVVYINYVEKIKVANWKKLLAKYPTLTLSKDEQHEHSDYGGNLLLGEINGFSFVCFEKTSGKGRAMRYWTEFRIKHHQNIKDFRLSMQSEYRIHKVGKALDMVKDVTIGIEDFDNRFLIKTNNVATCKKLFNGPLSEKFIKMSSLHFGDLSIGDSALVYTVSYHLEKTKRYECFKEVLEAALLMLTALERE